MRLTVYGASDDLVEFRGTVTNTDPGDAIASNGAEFPVYCPDGKGYFVLAGKNGDRLRLHPIYTNNGTWAFCPALNNEDDAIPDVKVIAGGHTMRLEIGTDGQEWEIFWVEKE